MRNLEALVRNLAGSSWHGTGSLQDGEPDKAADFGVAVKVIIQEEDGLYFTYRFDGNGNGAGDTCNLTLADAKEGAEVEYGIVPSDWREMDEVVGP